jgi:solute carrier family 25 protein 33/36
MILGPLFLIRTQCQVDSSKTMSVVAREVFKSSGVRGFWRGTLTNVAGRFVEEGTFWSVFEALKRVTSEGHFEDRNFIFASFAVVGLSGASKLIGTSIAYPYNVVMNHLRTVNKATGKYEHTKILPTIRHIYRADGFLGFYKGLSPQLLRSVLSKATQIYAFELAMSYYAAKKRRNVQV